jgi:putative ABC transport system permease protein
MSHVSRTLGFRALRSEWGRTLLAVLSVALGVGVFLAVRLANRAAVASFEAFTEGAGRGADWVVRTEGGPLPEARLKALEPLRTRAELIPVLEGSFNLRSTLEPFQLLGTDLMATYHRRLVLHTPSRNAQDRDEEALLAPMQRPDLVLISARLAEDQQLQLGSRLDGFVNEKPITLVVGGILPEDDALPVMPRNLMWMDLPALQSLLGRPAQLDRVELWSRKGTSSSELAEMTRPFMNEGLTLEAPERRLATGRGLSEAFRFNLTVLSLMSLAVGAYILFQAFDAAVSRRRETWATLRALGASEALLTRLVYIEAIVIGALGSALGVALGWGLAQGAVRVVSNVLQVHYGPSFATAAQLLPEEAGIAFTAGVVVSLLAAWVPARRASRIPAISMLRKGAEAHPMNWKRHALVGALLLVAGMAVASLPHLRPGVAWHGYVGAALVLFGGSLATIAWMPLVGSLGAGATRWTWWLRTRPLQRPTGRHAFAVAALCVASSMAVGVGVLARSFEGTLQDWIQASQSADLFISPQGGAGGVSHHRLPLELATALESDPAVAAVDRSHLVAFLFRGRTAFVEARDLEVLAPRGALLLAGGHSAQDVLNEVHASGLNTPGALVSESFAHHFSLKRGDTVDLPTPQGPRRMNIRGIFVDYSNEHGSLLVDRTVFESLFPGEPLSRMALFLRAQQDPQAVANRLSKTYPGLRIRSQAEERAQILRIFHRSFALTYALVIIALGVSLVGLVQALLSLTLARRAELWTLRALGATEREVLGILMGEGLGTALAGLLGGAVVGGLLARILVRVVQPQLFGWSLTFRFPYVFFAALSVGTLIAAALVLWPASSWGARLRLDRQAEEGA